MALISASSRFRPHIDDFRSTQPAHLRTRRRLTAAGIDAEREVVERSLRAAIRRGDELAEAELLFLRARSLSMRADARAAEAYDAALEFASRSGNSFWRAITLVQRASTLDDGVAALASLWEGVQLLGSIEGAGIHLVRAQLSLMHHCSRFDPAYASALLDEIDIDDVELGAFECNALGGICRELGRYEAALAWFERALAAAAATHPLRVPFALLGAAVVHADMGDFASSAECCRRALEHHDSDLHRPRSILELARALTALGRADEGERLLLDFVAHPDTETWTLARRAALSALARLVAERAPEEAIAHLSRAVELADVDADEDAGLADRRMLVGLLRTSDRRAEYDAHVIEYVRRLELADERSRGAADERRRSALELHRMRSDLELQALEARHRRFASEYTTHELARQAATTAAFADSLQALKEDLLAVLDSGDTPRGKLGDIRHVIDRQSAHELGMQSLEVAFTKINPTFCSTLVTRHPELSKEETRVCMLLRMRLSSADIARYLNRSPRSVENHRFRIRRKLALGTTDSLADALAEFA